jgi:cysteine sulfinate desulfinase/cysteine desulfurase-like protein/glyoxylase-like metal-dependent hydrolase (beta-lactamase superfamily II)/rhodanese-related sulfurtransferase
MTQQKPLSQIYLDANATTPVLPKAAAAALTTMETLFGNPSSSHISGLRAKQIMDQARTKAKQVLGSGNGQIIFTSGATEGIQTGILSGLYYAKSKMLPGEKYTILYGATEHKAVPESLKHWNNILEVNAKIKAIPVNHKGDLDLDFIAKEVPNALMICTMAVNNETGVYQDLTRLEDVIRQHSTSVFWLVDCVQALGKTSLALANTSIDYAPFSGHKLYGPKGIGFVYIRENAPFTPFIAGGGQEGGLRSGTENLPGLAALNVIFDMLLSTQDDSFSDITQLNQFRTQLVKTLKRAFPKVVFNHSFDNSVPTTLNFSIPGFSSKEMMDLFDAANIRVSSGSACSSKVTRSFVLDAMGLPKWQSESAIRMSFGPAMTQIEVDEACERIEQSADALGQSCLTLDSNSLDPQTQLDGLVQFKIGGSSTWLYVDKTTQSAIVIDPLAEITTRLMTILSCQKLTLTAAIDTHGHADHVSAREQLVKTIQPNKPTDSLGWPAEHQYYTLNGQSYPMINVGTKYLVNVATPGHTDDSISLLLCSAQEQSEQLVIDYVFSGDLILIGSLGRTNFSTSSAQKMFQSLQLLHSIVGNSSLLCTSHDYNNEFVTTIGVEISRNSLLADVINQTLTEMQFVQKKTRLDNHIADEVGSEILCGAFIDSCQKNAVIEYDTQSLAYAMQKTNYIKLIDIREPHEYILNHDQQFSLNVPLTRLVDFISTHQDKAQKLVLVCRSGSRSHIAAQALSRLGFKNVGHLKGGYALCH